MTPKRSVGRPKGSVTRGKAAEAEATDIEHQNVASSSRKRRGVENPQCAASEQDPTSSKEREKESREVKKPSTRNERNRYYFDDVRNSLYPCPKCPYEDKTSAGRNFHVRNEHPGYIYTPGDELNRFASPPRSVRNRIKKPKPAESSGNENKQFVAAAVNRSTNPFEIVPICDPQPSNAIHEQKIGEELRMMEEEMHKPAVFGPSRGIRQMERQHQKKNVFSAGDGSSVRVVERKAPNRLNGEDDDEDSDNVDVEANSEGEGEGEILTEDVKTEDVSIPAEDADDSSAPKANKRRQRRIYNDESKIPKKVKYGNPDGVYKCYIDGCLFRGAYRSIRAEHMRVVHPDWEMPDRFGLQRLKVGLPLDPTIIPPFKCSQCEWRGHYRATRANHIKREHPEFYAAVPRKAETGGYQPGGTYGCYISSCGWRGASRSTRNMHMKRCHPEFDTSSVTRYNKPQPLKLRLLTDCFECGVRCLNHVMLIRHVRNMHGLGSTVSRRFNSNAEFEDWLEVTKANFPLQLERQKQQTHPDRPDNEVVHYYCSYVNSRQYLKSPKAKNSFTSKYLSEKGTKYCLNHGVYGCTAFLKVVRNKTDDSVQVDGCAEHCGHRFGTMMVRMGKLDRDALQQFLYPPDEHSGVEKSLQHALDVIRLTEGLTMDYGIIESYTADTLANTRLRTNPFTSLYKTLLDNKHPLLTFYNVYSQELVRPIRLEERLERFEQLNMEMEKREVGLDDELRDEFMALGGGYALGLMTEDMKALWRACGVGGVVCIDEMPVDVGGEHFTLFMAFVVDDGDVVRCVSLFFSQTADRAEFVRQFLTVDYGAPICVLMDYQLSIPDKRRPPAWPEAFNNIYGPGHGIEFLYGGWHVLETWASIIEKHNLNRIDAFCVISALRRWLRVTDEMLFDLFAAELFEALQETNAIHTAKFIDSQLHYEYLFKRWCPYKRKAHTQHNDPLWEISTRAFKEMFLAKDEATRFDEYMHIVANRLVAFNSIEKMEMFTSRPIDPPREVPSRTLIAMGLMAAPGEPLDDDPDVGEQFNHVGEPKRDPNNIEMRSGDGEQNLDDLQGEYIFDDDVTTEEIVRTSEEYVDFIEEIDENGVHRRVAVVPSHQLQHGEMVVLEGADDSQEDLLVIDEDDVVVVDYDDGDDYEGIEYTA